MNRTIYLFSLILPFFFTSCVEYQFVSLQSRLPQGRHQAFVKETDTLAISYYFSGLNCPISVEVYNKLDVPIYVDWKRSFLIINQESIPFWADRETYASTSEGYQIQVNPQVASNIQLTEGYIIQEESIKMIPPKSFVSLSPLFVQNQFLSIPKDLKPEKAISKSNVPMSAKRYTFSAENSPLYLRSYIATSAFEDFSEISFQDDAFWVSEIVQSSSQMIKTEFTSANQFYLRQEDTETATGLAVVLGVLLVLGSGAY